MFKEKLLKHQIEQVEKAGYVVIPRERIHHLGAQYTEDLDIGERLVNQQGYREHRDRSLLLSLASELKDAVRWTRDVNKELYQRVTRIRLIVILPKKDKDNESTRCVPRFTDAPGRYARTYRVPEGWQGYAKGGAPGAG